MAEHRTEQELFFARINLAWKLVAFTLTLSLLFYAAGGWRDSTDAGTFSRSGMTLHRDNLTGCEYLSGRNGGLTPRLTAAGLHMGCRS